MKLTPFEDRKDFFLPEKMPFYPIVCDSKSEGSRYVLSWVPAIESVFARDYFFDNTYKPPSQPLLRSQNSVIEAQKTHKADLCGIGLSSAFYGFVRIIAHNTRTSITL